MGRDNYIQCKVCLNSIRSDRIKSHQRQHKHKTKNPMKTCSICRKSMFASNLRRHKKVHDKSTKQNSTRMYESDEKTISCSSVEQLEIGTKQPIVDFDIQKSNSINIPCNNKINISTNLNKEENSDKNCTTEKHLERSELEEYSQDYEEWIKYFKIDYFQRRLDNQKVFINELEEALRKNLKEFDRNYFPRRIHNLETLVEELQEIMSKKFLPFKLDYQRQLRNKQNVIDEFNRIILNFECREDVYKRKIAEKEQDITNLISDNFEYMNEVTFLREHINEKDHNRF